MDIQMPIVDGYEATATIRAWERANSRRRTPILALTASALEEAVHRTKAAGCDAHVTKPVRKSTLLDAIRTAIEGNPLLGERADLVDLKEATCRPSNSGSGPGSERPGPGVPDTQARRCLDDFRGACAPRLRGDRPHRASNQGRRRQLRIRNDVGDRPLARACGRDARRWRGATLRASCSTIWIVSRCLPAVQGLAPPRYRLLLRHPERRMLESRDPGSTVSFHPWQLNVNIPAAHTAQTISGDTASPAIGDLAA